MQSGKCWIMTGAVLAGLAVTLGAMAAHGLDKHFVKKYAGQTKSVTGVEISAAQKYIADFKTGAEYQMYHALGIITAGLLLGQGGCRKSLLAANWSFLLGIVFFSGGLYAYALTGETVWGMIAPIGGTLMIVGWVLLAIGAYHCGKHSDTELVPLKTEH
jgi:uncharacterized membrane protein YgdD (TMEM256/DUF423 family)